MKNCHNMFYSNHIIDDVIFLDDVETNHAISVLRIKSGQSIQIANGNGTIYDCLCVDITKQSISCKITGKTVVPKIVPELTLMAGLPDRDHFETILEHTAALGVSRVIPLIMDNCRKPWWESWAKLQKRHTSKMVVSMKQCLYPYVPQLDAPISLDKIVDKHEKPIIVADMHGKNWSDVNLSFRQQITGLVGPPGGLSASELKLLESHGSLLVKIAPNRLRTELAATVFCSMIPCVFR